MMLKRMVIMLVLVASTFGAVFGFLAFKARMISQIMAAQSNPPQAVSTAAVALAEWQPRLEAVGSARAVNGANLSSQISGIVSAIHFESGADVKQGSPLIDLIAEDDIAHLEALKATTELARLTYERDQRLVRTKAISEQTVDSDKWTLKNGEAQVAQQQALVDYKSIKAPFSGRLGIRQVDLGQFLAAGTTVVTLQQLDPIYVDFFLPEQALARIKVGQHVAAKIDAYPGHAFDGAISAINSLVDIATRNVQIRATFKNPDSRLLPGMFATVDIDVGSAERFVTLPQTAIAYNSYGNIVFLVEEKGKDAAGKPRLVARQTFVTTGETRGDQVSILSGVKEGDTVVTAGQMKLRNDTPLMVNNAVQPLNDPNPQPVDR
ncbi:MAG: efflux RND transporter periplasmic adaptor subunit [Methylocystis sp.]